MNTVNRRFVFAGGPGAGKTTVLNALLSSELSSEVSSEVYCAGDSARTLIRARLKAGLSPRPAPVEFAQSILDADVVNYLAAPVDTLSFFERGIVDALGMLKQCDGMAEQEIASHLDRYPYNNMVFVFPPWEEIYRTDEERDQTFAESVAVFASVKAWYGLCGYQITEVPHAPVEERVEFVRRLTNDILGHR